MYMGDKDNPAPGHRRQCEDPPRAKRDGNRDAGDDERVDDAREQTPTVLLPSIEGQTMLIVMVETTSHLLIKM